MNDVSAYDVCDLHGAQFPQGDVCPVCEDEMWQWVRDVVEVANWSYSELIFEEQALVHEGDVYWLMIEQASNGEYRYTLFEVADWCREPGVPW